MNNDTKKSENVDLNPFELEIYVNGEKKKLLVPVEPSNRRISIPIYVANNSMKDDVISKEIRLIALPETNIKSHSIQVTYFKTLYSDDELFDRISYKKIINRKAYKVILDKIIRKLEKMKGEKLPDLDVMVKSAN